MIEYDDTDINCYSKMISHLVILTDEGGLYCLRVLDGEATIVPESGTIV